jgi:hypothetical protein
MDSASAHTIRRALLNLRHSMQDSRPHTSIKRMRFASGSLISGVALISLTACSSFPIKQVTSLSPSVKADAVAYNDAVGDAADGILLNNILRSEYIEPLNLSQLSSISGALSLQGTVAFSLPWGTGTGGAPSSIGQRSAAPGVTASTSPTYTLTPLNTQAFIQSILQPVSPAYVLNRWQAGISHELLLLLFVKEIDFPRKTSGIPYSFINDPDDVARFTAFRNLIDSLVLDDAELKTVDVLDPVGPEFTLNTAFSEATTKATVTTYKTDTATGITPPPTTNTTAPRNLNADSTGFTQITGNTDGQYHFGNVLDSEKKIVRGQLYRVYAGQVELCVNPNNLRVPAYADSDSKEAIFGLATETAVTNPPTPPPTFTSAFKGGAHPSTSPSASGAGAPTTATGKGTAATTPSPAGSPQALTAALLALRTSAMVNAAAAKGDEIVLEKSDESGFQSNSAHFVHIQWRSVAEIFDYLGAILRYNESHSDDNLDLRRTDPNVINNWPSPTDVSAAADASVHTASPLPAAFNLQPAIFFRVYHDNAEHPQFSWAHLTAIFHGDHYWVPDIDPKRPNIDDTKVIMAMLNTLVDYSSQPGPASTSAPLRLLPIP